MAAQIFDCPPDCSPFPPLLLNSSMEPRATEKTVHYMAANFFKRYGTNPGGPICTILWNKVRSIGMEQGPFHTQAQVWYRGPFHRYGTDHVPGVARIRKIRGLILHDRTIPVPYPFHTSESDFQRVPHPRVWYRGPFHRYGTRFIP